MLFAGMPKNRWQAVCRFYWSRCTVFLVLLFLVRKCPLHLSLTVVSEIVTQRQKYLARRQLLGVRLAR